MIKQRDWGNSCGGELWHFYTLHLRHQHPSLPPSLTHPPTATSNAAVSASGRKERRETKAIRDGHKRGGAPVTWRSLSEKTSTPRNAEKLPAAGLHLHWTHYIKKKPQYRLIFCFRCTRQLTCESKIRAATTDRLAVTTDRLAVNYQINHRLIWVIFKRKNEIFSGFFPDLWQ